jgi:hypothetical protein
MKMKKDVEVKNDLTQEFDRFIMSQLELEAQKLELSLMSNVVGKKRFLFSDNESPFANSYFSLFDQSNNEEISSFLSTLTNGLSEEEKNNLKISFKKYIIDNKDNFVPKLEDLFLDKIESNQHLVKNKNRVGEILDKYNISSSAYYKIEEFILDFNEKNTLIDFKVFLNSISKEEIASLSKRDKFNLYAKIDAVMQTTYKEDKFFGKDKLKEDILSLLTERGAIESPLIRKLYIFKDLADRNKNAFINKLHKSTISERNKNIFNAIAVIGVVGYVLTTGDFMTPKSFLFEHIVIGAALTTLATRGFVNLYNSSKNILGKTIYHTYPMLKLATKIALSPLTLLWKGVSRPFKDIPDITKINAALENQNQMEISRILEAIRSNQKF